jgi:long-chain acyl-CoA synthetase
MDALDLRSWSQPAQDLALVCNEGSFTYEEVRRKAGVLAHGLRDLGAAGHNVAFLLRNGVDLVCSYLACLEAEATAVPLNPRSTAIEVDHYLTFCEAPWLLVREESLSSLTAAFATLGSSHTLLPVEDPASWGRLVQREPLAGGRTSDARPAVIFFTSGSTQGPRGVMYSRGSLLSAIAPFFAARFVGAYGSGSGKLVYLSTASIADTVGCIHLLWTLLAGGTAVIHEGFDADRYLDAVERYSPTHSTLFLPHAIDLLAHPRASRDRFRSLRMLCFAGDKTPVGLIESCVSTVGLVPLIGYGLTESFVVALNLSPSSAKFGSMGQPVEGVEVKIVDEGERPVPHGAPGEILVRSPQNMLGYWRDPAATRDAFDRGGWLKTGDLASLAEDGYLWFLGRRKHILIRGGENISPLEVEGALMRHPAVKAAIVVAVRDGLEGEVPEAYVELGDGASMSEASLLFYLAEQLIHYKIPRAIRFVTQWPLTRTGKIDRLALQRHP